MPDPMTIPITIIVASSSPSLRGSCFIDPISTTLFQRHGILLDVGVHARFRSANGRRRRPYVMEGFRIFDTVLSPERPVPRQDELPNVVAVGGEIVVAQKRQLLPLPRQLRPEFRPMVAARTLGHITKVGIDLR